MGRAVVAGNSAGSREIVPGWKRYGNVCGELWGGEQMLGTVVVGRTDIKSQSPVAKKSLQQDKFGKGCQVCSPPALQAVLVLWRITDVLDQVRYHLQCAGADGDVSVPWFCSVESMKGERAFPWVRAALSGVLYQDNPGTCRGRQGGTVGQITMGFFVRKP